MIRDSVVMRGQISNNMDTLRAREQRFQRYYRGVSIESKVKAENDLWLIIPVGRRTKYVDNLIKNSGVCKHQIVIVKNRLTPTFSGVVNIDQPEILNIQLWWQIGIAYVEQEGGRFVAIVNDDVDLKSDQLTKMLHELLEWKVAMVASKVSKKYGWGHAFLIDLSKGVRPDTRFRWYYGDYDLKYQAKRRGGFKMSTQEIVHLEPGNNTKNYEFLNTLTENDRRAFKYKYPIRFFLVTCFNVYIKLTSQMSEKLKRLTESILRY